MLIFQTYIRKLNYVDKIASEAWNVAFPDVNYLVGDLKITFMATKQ